MGTLIPPWYRVEPTSLTGLLVAAFFFGASSAVAFFDFTKAVRQSRRSWRRCHRLSAYIILVWLVWGSCISTSICIWLFLVGKIPPSIWYFVGMLLTWVVQIQGLMQILANRLGLILYNPDKERRIKIALLIAIGIVNVSVFCIWVPARLQINETFIRINEVWDRAEKAIFAAIDLTINTYFMWLVRSKLVSCGLTKYNLVYKYNLLMVFVSISLDVMLIGLMSLKDEIVYIQVHPFVFLTKLNIEMNMADLLGSIVKKSKESRMSIDVSDVHRPHLGVGPVVFDREWLGSAKDFIIPSGDQHNDQTQVGRDDLESGRNIGRNHDRRKDSGTAGIHLDDVEL